MTSRILVCFPTSDALGLRAEAAQLALGLAARGDDVIAVGASGPWRHLLRAARVTAADLPWPCDERRLSRALQDFDPQIVHAFGAYIAHSVLPLAVLIGAGAVATLGHDDLARINPALFRTASAVFVQCDYLREQVARRLPALPVITTGYLLSPDDGTFIPRNRFLAAELGVEEDAPVVLMADRYNGSEADVALALIEAMPQISHHLPELQAVIVGDGLRLAELESAALEVNEQLGRRAVLLPGYREDIRQLLSLATVALGSGRFAMEAIGAGVALVAAGAAGMIGTFTPDTAQVAGFTCCGKHGKLDPISARALAAEVIGLFAYPQYRERFAAEDQAAVLAQMERTTRTAQIAAYYQPTAPLGVLTRAPHHLALVLPDDLRSLLFTLPAVTALRAQYPLARLTLIAAPAHRRLLQAIDLGQVVLEKPGTLREWPALLRALLKPRADVCVTCTDHVGDYAITTASLAPHRVGFADGRGSLALSDPIHVRIAESPARMTQLLHALGVAHAMPVPPPELPPAIRELMDLTLVALGVEPTDGFILLSQVAPAGRAWPDSAWIALTRLLGETCPETVLVHDEHGISLLTAPESAVPVTDSLMLAALLARASLVVAPDDSVLHLADLLGVPAIGLFGPTAPRDCRLPNEYSRSLYHQAFCRPCRGEECVEQRCLRAISPAEVEAAITQILAAYRLPAAS
jgi:ADP-heptose:LPS heptosyltransferase/glycosyltransferase involved in cell wall biosynthesis